MISQEITQTAPKPLEPNCSPRISFSADFLDEKNFISIIPNSPKNREIDQKEQSERGEFEFLSSNNMNPQTMITADELIFEGKLLPFWQISSQTEKLSKINLKSDIDHDDNNNIKKEGGKVKKEEVNWFIDDDPSPRPPKCTVLWKELLRLKKQRGSTLSPSSSSSSSSSSSRSSLGDLPSIEEGKERKGNREKHDVKRIIKGLERTRSTNIRIRPVVNVPICTHGKSNGLPPLFSLKKGRLER